MEKISFGKYDSSAFPTFPQSIGHSKINPLLIENLSDSLQVIMDSRNVSVQEPSCLFKDFIVYFEDDYFEEELPKEEHYRPELTALRLYDCADLWYVILLANDIYSVNQYNVKTIKYIPPSLLTKLEKFVQKAKRVSRPYNETQEITVITM